MGNTTLRNNTEAQRYELMEGDQVVAFASYQPVGDDLRMTHTEVVAGNEGKGYGSALARQVLEDARARNRKIVPVCEFIEGYIRKHPEYAGLVRKEA